ncbi:unnamed protein product, partial [Mesorhabditis belari]|uniref:BACK domain-containing protein n=1 Tax=Mesorhabditis belari TaxID=2138241 RepID=A0AAF3J3V2_9BILA
MRLHSKPYSYETEIRSSDGKSRPLHISQVRRLGSLLQLARKSHDFDGRIVYAFPLPASLVDVLLALIDKQAVLIAALASFSNYDAYILIENFKKMGIQPVWMFKLLDAYFTRCSDKDCVAFWRVAKEFNYAIGEKLVFRRLLYTVVPQVLSNTIHESFLDISADNLIELLKDDKLNVDGAESKLIEVIDMWVQADVENRAAARPLLLSYVRKQGLQDIIEKTVDMSRDESLLNTTLPPREPRDRLLYIGGWNIHSASTKQYFFEKFSSEWRLAAIPKLPLKLCGFVSVTLGSVGFSFVK